MRGLRTTEKRSSLPGIVEAAFGASSQRGVLVAVLALALSTLFEIAARVAGDPNAWIALHSTWAFGCVVAAALLVGRRAGFLVGAAAGLLFLILVAYAQPPRPILAGLPIVVLWAAAGYLVGAGADALRARVVRAYDQTAAERDHQRRIAEALQSALIPPRLPTGDGVRFDAYFRPAGHGDELGGDFYDVWRIPDTDSFGFVLGDVCGKGAEAAALASLARHTVRTASVIGLGPRESLHALNDGLRRRTDSDRFVTACAGQTTPTDAGLEVTIVSAGHPWPILKRAAGETDERGEPGTFLGIWPDPQLAPFTISLGHGDLLVFYTDGATDVRAGYEPFGHERLIEHVRSSQSRGPSLLEDLHQALSDFSTGLPPDDIAILAIEARPSPTNSTTQPGARISSAT